MGQGKEEEVRSRERKKGGGGKEMNGFRESFSSLSHFSDAKGETGFPSKKVVAVEKYFRKTISQLPIFSPRLKNEVDSSLDIREML